MIDFHFFYDFLILKCPFFIICYDNGSLDMKKDRFYVNTKTNQHRNSFT